MNKTSIDVRLGSWHKQGADVGNWKLASCAKKKAKTRPSNGLLDGFLYNMAHVGEARGTSKGPI